MKNSRNAETYWILIKRVVMRGIEKDYTHVRYKLLIPLILEDWVLGYYSMKF